MSKNLIYMIAIDHDKSKHKHSKFAKYAINTWEFWCDLHDVTFIVQTTHDSRFNRPIWNKSAIFSHDFIFEYDKIGIVDSDTMIRWDAPNIFDEYDDQFCGVLDNDNLRWMYDSPAGYQKFWPDVKINPDQYINAGVLFFGQHHKPIFDAMLAFYLSNKTELDNMSLPNIGREQTNLNFILQKLDIKQKILSPIWNAHSMIHRDLIQISQDGNVTLTSNWQMGKNNQSIFSIEDTFMVKFNYIWHFNGMPIELRHSLMEWMWNSCKHKYNRNE